MRTQTSLVELNKYLGLVDPNEPKPLSRLANKDRQMLLLYLQGEPPREIVEQLGTSMQRFRRVVKSEVGQLVIEDYFRFCDQEFSTLYQLSVDAVRDALKSDDIDLRLKAADKFLRAHGKYDKSIAKQSTAEDVVRRILELKKDSVRVIEETKHITTGQTAFDEEVEEDE